MKKYTPLFYLLLLFVLLPMAASASVGLVSFSTQAGDDTITIIWETESEIDNSGYFVYRTEENAADFMSIVDKITVNTQPIRSQGSQGGRYELIDNTAAPNVTYYYWLEDIDTGGDRTQNGPRLGRIERGSVIELPTPTSVSAGGDATPTTTTTAATTMPTTRPTTANNDPTATLLPSATSEIVTQSTTPTSVPSVTATEGRVFITPSRQSVDVTPTTVSNVEPTSAPIEPTNTPLAAAPSATAIPPAGGQTDAPTATLPIPTRASEVDTAVNPTAVIQPTADTTANPTAVIEPTAVRPIVQPTATNVTEENSDAPVILGDSSNGDTSDGGGTNAPTGNVTTVAPEANETESVAEVEEPLSPTEEAISELIGDPAEGSPGQFGGEVTDVQQPNLVQPQNGNNNDNMLLWFGLVAGALLLLVGGGFALLLFGDRNR